MIASVQAGLSTVIEPMTNAGPPAGLGEVVGAMVGAGGTGPTRLPCGSSAILPMVKVIVTLPSDRTAADFTWAVRPGIVEESVTQLAQVGDCMSELSVESWALETRPLPSCCTRASR